MNKTVIGIIREYADLIDANKWEEIYNILEKGHYKIIGAFTETLLSVGINPLEYLDYVPDGYLYGSKTITDVHIPKHITSIGHGAFANIENLKNITIPSGVTSIEGAAFYGTSKLKTVTFEKGSQLTSIESGAFEDASSLKSIIIPSSVTRIGYGAFRGVRRIRIYAEAESKPSGWHLFWNRENARVVWGYKEE